VTRCHKCWGVLVDHSTDTASRESIALRGEKTIVELAALHELLHRTARELLGDISRNTIYSALRTGELSSVVIGWRRFISAAAIEEFIQASTTRVSSSHTGVRDRRPRYFAAVLRTRLLR
jgi:hypothetical protein